MTLRETQYIAEDGDRIAKVLKALGHPVRLRIVKEVCERDHRCCGDMCRCFDLSQSTISQHLSVLIEAGVLTAHKQGTKSCYSVCGNVFTELQAVFQMLAEYNRAGALD